MKQSFRYRKIALRKEYEQPLYAGGDETDDSGDESDAIPSYCGRSSVPRPLDFPLRVVEFPQEEETLIQSDSDDAGSTGGGMQSHTPLLLRFGGQTTCEPQQLLVDDAIAVFLNGGWARARARALLLLNQLLLQSNDCRA